jgi:hypothetical protein
MAQSATATLAQKEVFPVPPFPEATVIALPKVDTPFLVQLPMIVDIIHYFNL